MDDSKTPPDGTPLDHAKIMDLSPEAIKLATAAVMLRAVASHLTVASRDVDSMPVSERLKFLVSMGNRLVEASDICHDVRRAITGRVK